MFSIGDFARLGRVSVRMLRHYDAIGLLLPARVDESTGYRFYEAGQLRRLNRIIALKDLGFTLEQVRTILEERITGPELHGMLRLRRGQIEARIAEDTARLAQVEARLRTIESEGAMPTEEVLVKQVEAVRVGELSALAASYSGDDIGPVIRPLYDRLCAAFDAAGVVPTGPSIAYYEEHPDGVLIHAAFPVAVNAGGRYPFEVVDLPAIPAAATMIHRGSMDHVGATFEQLARWIEDNGYKTVGLAREVYLDCPAEVDKWVTELQETVVRA
jgi:DNA-binding transcriptional MerR regulator